LHVVAGQIMIAMLVGAVRVRVAYGWVDHDMEQSWC